VSGYFLDQSEGEVADLGIVTVRVVVPSAQTNGAFSVAEFHGQEGAWTIPHVHQRMEESFYVLGGEFDFTCGDRHLEAKEGSFVLVPRGTPHVMSARAGGGALLAVFAPGGLEEMFLELGRLPADSIKDPAVRAEIASRFDAVPV
jgi:quercetin dioxygenase-like cupin family protein